MVKLVNRAKMTIASGGAGNITLGTAVDGYQTFADAGVSDTDVVRYTIEDGDNWEIGTGVYTASGTTLVRTVTESSNSNAALTCSADAVIFVTMAAEDFTGNVAPIWVTLPETTKGLENDGSTAVTLTGVAIDEGGFPIQYSWDGFSGSTVYSDTSLPPQLHSAPTISSSGVASLIGSSNSSNAGTFNFRLKASDGVKTATATTLCELAFMYQTNLVGWYDAADVGSYSGSGTTIADKSGNSGPALTLHSGTSGSTVYNSSGTGSKASFTVTGYHAFETSHNFGSGQTVVLILRQTIDESYGLNGNSGYDGGMIVGTSFSGTATANRISGDNATANSEIFADKVSLGVGTVPKYGTVRAAMIGSGITSATAAQLHSLVQTDLDLSSGYTLGGSGMGTTLEVRAILIYNQTLTSTQIASIHNFYKSGYPSAADMPA